MPNERSLALLDPACASKRRCADRRRNDRRTLERAGLRDLFEHLPEVLDARIGSGGSELSGRVGQRFAVARTLLTRADTVLLDEPTAHLDGTTSPALMAGLRVAFADQIVVLVTHQGRIAEDGDQVIQLRLGRSRDRIPAADPRATTTSTAHRPL
ncbi:MAG: ATP-binding cassette domain-containing protein [Microbacteriaceae bacterium]